MESGSDKHLAAAGRRLGHLAGLAERSEQAERNILTAAERRLADIHADVAKLRPRALTDSSAGELYTNLIAEKGQVELVIARAKRALG